MPREGAEFTFGKPAIAKLGVDCCGKPQGCSNPSETCLYRNHPYKRFMRGDITLDELNRLLPPKQRRAA